MESRTLFKYHFDLPHANTFYPILLAMTVLAFDHSANWCFLVSVPVRTQSKQRVYRSHHHPWKDFMTLLIPQLRLEDMA